jgi:hypothetical protein
MVRNSWGRSGLVLILLAGLILHPFWKSAVEHFGTAVFIAGVLGATIDWWLKKQITEDVFSAAMGYELPEDLKTEIRNVYGNKILCTKHVHSVELEDRGNGLVSVTVSLARTLENISEVKQPIVLKLGIDDWGLPIPAKIIEFCYYKDEDQKTCLTEAARHADGSLSMQWEGVLRPRETITVLQKYCEIKHQNDEHLVTFTYATLRPTVSVHAPDHLAWTAGFVRRPE